MLQYVTEMLLIIGMGEEQSKHEKFGYQKYLKARICMKQHRLLE